MCRARRCCAYDPRVWSYLLALLDGRRSVDLELGVEMDASLSHDMWLQIYYRRKEGKLRIETRARIRKVVDGATGFEYLALGDALKRIALGLSLLAGISLSLAIPPPKT